ncbi:hypothetical protein ACIRSS_23920 [Amycolatopsis sp. NPDC101161]|uniref:hypothetical protein n=1 Tax=Amycolatopsis sp. NPDC101161 TaxID=3363940 RepID=UPI00380F5E1D
MPYSVITIPPLQGQQTIAAPLYRGSVAAHRGNWSWTDSRDVARTYAAGGFGGRLPGAIWTALVEPERLLARNTDRDEYEYIVDTEFLPLVPVTGCGAFG